MADEADAGSEQDTAPGEYKKWLDTYMTVEPDLLMQSKRVLTCVACGGILAWHKDFQPSLSNIESRILIHMMLRHGEDYERIFDDTL